MAKREQKKTRRATSSPNKRGRDAAADGDRSGNKKQRKRPVDWDEDAVLTLVDSRFKVYKDLFRSAHNNTEKNRAWVKVAADVQRKTHSRRFDTLACQRKVAAMKAKYTNSAANNNRGKIPSVVMERMNDIFRDEDGSDDESLSRSEVTATEVAEFDTCSDAISEGKSEATAEAIRAASKSMLDGLTTLGSDLATAIKDSVRKALDDRAKLDAAAVQDVVEQVIDDQVLPRLDSLDRLGPKLDSLIAKIDTLILICAVSGN